jgi:hypothetical protein
MGNFHKRKHYQEMAVFPASCVVYIIGYGFIKRVLPDVFSYTNGMVVVLADNKRGSRLGNDKVIVHQRDIF